LTPAAAKPDSETNLARAAFYITWACAASALVSIAVSQILLALALCAVLLSGVRLRLPRIWIPLALFMAGTVASMLLSGSIAAGRPQIRKFYVYLMLLVVYSAFHSLAQVRRLEVSWTVVGGAAGALGIVQFAVKVRESRPPGVGFYEHYVAERITGFTSNWQTYSGEMMVVLLVAAAFLMFSPRARGRLMWIGLAAAVLTSCAVLLGYTRGTWLATAAAGLYLVWQWKRRLLVAVPVLLILILWANPGGVRARFVSAFEPHGETDSNQHRIVCWRTGWQMIKAHPWFGIGPEMVGPELMKYVPEDIPRPLPAGWYGHLHNVYIHYAAERGVPTMLMLVAALITILLDCRRALRKLPPGPGELKAVLHGTVAVVLGIMVNGLFEVNLGDSEVLALFLAVVASGYAALDAKEASIA
jgi:putative inorganic carbon (HCO3(-)) transporter